MVSFMSAEIAKLNRRVEQFCSSPSPLFLDETQILLKELLKAFCYEEDFLRRNKLEQLLGMVRRASETDVSTYAKNMTPEILTLQNTCSAVRVIWSVTIPSTTIWPMCFEGKGMIRLTAVRLLRCSSQVFKSENHFVSLIWACSLH